MSLLDADGQPIAPAAPAFSAEMIRHEMEAPILFDPNVMAHPEHDGVSVVRVYGPGRIVYINVDLLPSLPLSWILEMMKR